MPSEVHLKTYLNKLHSDITSKEISTQKKGKTFPENV